MPAACFAAPVALRDIQRRSRPATSARAPRCAQQSFDRGSVPGVSDAASASLSDTNPLGAVAAVAGGSIPGAPASPTWPGGSGSGDSDEPLHGLDATLAAAVRAGRVSSDEARRYLALESGLLRGICALIPGLRDRLAANPLFFTQLAVELFVGCVSKMTAEISARGDRLRAEAALVASDMALEIATDVSLVWLLSPRLRIAASSAGGFLAGCPSHASQIGSFSPAQRMATFAYKGGQFAAIAFASALVGHGITKMFVARRDRVRAERGEPPAEGGELAPVVPTAAVWGGFVMTSSNVRYQMVNGIEQRFVGPLLSRVPVVRTAVTFGIRFSNCMVGSMTWIPWAKYWGVQ